MGWRTGNEEITGKLTRRGLPQLDEEKIKLVDRFERYDGPLSGLLEFEGKVHWFDFIGDCAQCEEDQDCEHSDAGEHYFYVLKPVSEEQLTEARRFWDAPDYCGPDLKEVNPIGWFMVVL